MVRSFKTTSANRAISLLIAIASALTLTSLPLLSAQALSGSNFQAGNIISDAVFTNYMSMSAGDIQNFLNAQTPNCDTSGSLNKSYYYNSSTGYVGASNVSGSSYITTNRATYGQRYDSYYNTTKAAASYVCLKDYVENPTTMANNLQNPGASVPGGLSAAQIIANAAQTYSISPKVLLVTLQKEQGLVTDDWPWTNEYQIAMGYACPDSGSCNTAYYGFSNQVNNAAKQFRRYLTNPNNYNYVVGNDFIYYNPNSSCGGTNVSVQDESTAALYNYTPYQPNGAALANTSSTSSGGTGDSCSAYGNRNFWWYFNSWFGSSLTNTAYAWNIINQSAYTDSAHTSPYTIGKTSLQPGAKAYLQVTARNNGYQTWQQSVVKLGTSQGQDRASVFADSSWQSSSRILMTDTSVAPGNNATYNFSITAPTALGSYNECFNLVAEYVTWLNQPDVCFPIDVTNPISPSASANTRLNGGSSLTPGQYLLSSDTHSRFMLQTDGNAVVYNNFAPTWADNIANGATARLAMQTDGNLVAYNNKNVPVWATATNGNPGAYLVMQTDGNAVIYTAGGQAIWSSGTMLVPNGLNYVDYQLSNASLYAGQSLETAGGAYQLTLQTDGNLVLYRGTTPIWATGTDGRSTAFLAMQSDGNLVLYDTSNRPIWASHSDGHGASRVVMQQDGNLVVYANSGAVTWATATNGR